MTLTWTRSEHFKIDRWTARSGRYALSIVKRSHVASGWKLFVRRDGEIVHVQPTRSLTEAKRVAVTYVSQGVS